MNKVQIIKAVAEIAGWHTVQQNPMYPSDPLRLAGFFGRDQSALCGIPIYTESRDAIAEVIREQVAEHICRNRNELFKDSICQQVYGKLPEHFSDNQLFWVMFQASEHQLCVALLKATGKWVE